MTNLKKEDRIPNNKIEKVCIHHMDEIVLRQTIENLRSILYQSVSNNSFTNPSVIAISQELDEYIVRFQQLTSPAKAKETIQ
ncbi:aspartyl-phosphate phosphatase Spo0E family protein [Brevibacillus migulae]|uniref:aspartyl-phosphate phosphatase Spo0E family protein n=1 Tax=Brevibacillus migulae TaxID=1644114 RepID=UPI00106DFD00|nr:aspartyl-phosphate phosphatase Spo0E family protein [Brevibacillus migulae]